MALELTEKNWRNELAHRKHIGQINPFIAERVTELLDSKDPTGVAMSDSDALKLVDTVFVIKFTDVKKKLMVVYRPQDKRVALVRTAW